MIEYFKESIRLDEMAFKRNIAIDKIKAYDSTFKSHLSYLFILGRQSSSFKHWRNEIANTCEILDNLKIKKSGKLDIDDYIDYICQHVDTDNDAKAIATLGWNIHGEGLPGITTLNLTREDYRAFKNFLNDLFSILPSMFVDITDHTKEEYQQLIEDVYDRNKR